MSIQTLSSYRCHFVALLLTLLAFSSLTITIAFSPSRSSSSSSAPNFQSRRRKVEKHNRGYVAVSAPIIGGMVSSSSSSAAASSSKEQKGPSNILTTNGEDEKSIKRSSSPSNATAKNNSKNSTSLFYRMPHEQVLEKIQDMQQKDRDGKKLTQAECDNMLALCVASDEWDYVLDVLEIYKHQNLKQIRSSYTRCLQLCFESGNGESAKEILKAMSAAKIQPEPSDIALTVVAICRNNIEKRGYWRKALAVIKQQTSSTMVTRVAPAKSKSSSSQSKKKGNKEKNTSVASIIPVQAYGTILECIKEEGNWKEAVRLLRMMEETKSTTASTMMQHPAPELSTYRAAIECCVNANQPEQAVQVLFSMKNRGVQPSSYTFELIISGLSKRLQWRRAMQLLDTMTTMDIPKTVVTYNSVIGACARAKEVGMAKNLLSKMKKEGIRPNEVSFNSVIGACASTSRWKDALSLLDQCYREPGVTPNIYIYTNAMRACAKGKQTKRALNLLQVVKDKGLSPDCYCYTAVIDACAKGGMWKRALSLLREMKAEGIEPTEVTYSVAISACGNGGQWQKALELLGQMKDKEMSINLITYNAAITALSKAARQRNNARNGGNDSTKSDGEELWFKALKILKQMKENGIEPDGFCYSSAISCLGAQGRWEESLNLINVMKKGGPRTRPNKIAYTAAINACGRAGEAKHALELFQNMKDEGLSADRVAYNALFSALRVAGNADKTFELWEEICGTRPTSTTAIATAKHVASPDIITVTDCVATLVNAERLGQVDEVFREAVKRGIILRGNTLDSQWETDLSGMSFPVARAACRYVINQCLELKQEDIEDVTFITGVGRAQQRRKEVATPKTSPASFATAKGSALSALSGRKNPMTSLRDYVQEVVEMDFDPALRSSVPTYAQGTVVVDKDSIIQWSANHQG